MNKGEIKEFLRNKPGYLKEGGKRMRNNLRKKGFETTIKDCKQAIREVVNELKVYPFTSDKPSLQPKILFWDIEVSYGLAKAWRPTYNGVIRYNDFIQHPKIICISWKWNNSDEVYNVKWDKNQDDKELLKQFIPELDRADFSVAHNGDRFDLPWIRTRALFHDLDMLPSYSTVDTLKIARSTHKLPSNRLDDIGHYFGLGKKIKTEMKLWDDIILHNDNQAMEDMISYCNQDVFLLEKIYNKLSKYTLNKNHVGVENGKTKQTNPYNGDTNIELVKTITTKAGTIKRIMKDSDTGKYFNMSNTNYKKFLEINK